MMSVITKTDNQSYLQKLGQQSDRGLPVIKSDLLNSLRKQASQQIQELPLPTKRDEEWLFTDLSDLVTVDFEIATAIALDKSILQQFILDEGEHNRLVFVNGFYSPELSDLTALPTGIYVGNLGDLPQAKLEKLPHYLGKAEGSDEIFTVLNTSGLQDVMVIWADANAEIQTPIHCLFLAVVSPQAALIQPRVLVITEANSSLTLAESYATVTDTCSDRPQRLPYFTNAVTEVFLGKNSRLTHIRNQRESGDSFHIAKTAIAQEKESQYKLFEVNLGAKLYRHNLEIFQRGEQTQTDLYGLTVIAGRQVSDTHSAIHLRHPQGVTNQLHKCIVDNYAHAIFSGKIFVPKAAQMTNANQLNRNLVLSSKGRVNTKPELQITADNVKCSHGATISQLEADEIFYLRSRGLNDYDSRHLLIDAFAGEILEKIPLKSLQNRLNQCISCRTI
ncbi:MAG: Fe-S cluster assembly protein SufD [Microcystaceae cyanobacterium]